MKKRMEIMPENPTFNQIRMMDFVECLGLKLTYIDKQMCLAVNENHKYSIWIVEKHYGEFADFYFEVSELPFY